MSMFICTAVFVNQDLSYGIHKEVASSDINIVMPPVGDCKI
jgi:hypothetical protein